MSMFAFRSVAVFTLLAGVAVFTLCADAVRISTLTPYLFSNTSSHDESSLLPGRTVFAAKGQVPFLNELSLVKLEGVAPTDIEPAGTVVRLGVAGHCKVQVGSVQTLDFGRGESVTVLPGLQHTVLGNPGGCTFLEFRVASGNFSFPAGHGALKSDVQQLQSVPTAHNTDLLSKRVLISKGTVPGLFQLSIARFSPGAVCEEHSHATASEVYVNWDGPGCHVKAMDSRGSWNTYDLTSGKAAVLNPGTPHAAWNENKFASCYNVNMMVGNPDEAQ